MTDMPGWLSDAVAEFDAGRAQEVLDAVLPESGLISEWHLQRLPGTGGGGFGSAVFRATLLYTPGIGSFVVNSSAGPDIDCVTAILKVTMRVDSLDSYHSADSVGPVGSHTSDLRYAEREIEFYRAMQSPGFLTMPAGLRTPELYVSWIATGSVGIVIEDIGSPQTGNLEQVACLARHLGELTASPVQPQPWFSRNGIEQEQRLLAGRLPHAIETRGSANFGRVFGPTHRDQLLRIHRSAPALMRRMRTLPMGFAHLDPFSRNSTWKNTADGPVSVLFDWAGVGLAPVGSDAGSLTWLTAAYLDVAADELSELDDAVFCCYVEGLAKGGFEGSVADVRTAYVATTLLRATAMMANIAPLLATDHSTIATTVGRPLDEIVDGWVALRPFLEARIAELFTSVI